MATIKLNTDYHSHILPGVDDGVHFMEDSLKILAKYEELGITTVWCTPHVMEDCPNTTENLKARFQELKNAYKGQIELHLAAEYMMDNLFIERLESKDILTLEDKVLVETSYFNPPAPVGEMLENIKSKGYYPVLAHPERYMYMDRKQYKALKAAGIFFQMNLGSLKGYYGRHVKRKAKWLKRKGFYDFVGSDLHRRSMIDKIMF